jgi:PAS domain S-box-containing protein
VTWSDSGCPNLSDVDEVREEPDEDRREDDDSGLLETLGLAVIHLDEHATLVSYNLAAERLLRWADGSRRGRSFDDLLTGPDRQDPDESVGAALADGRPWAGPLTLRGSDRDMAPVPATVVPVRGLEAEPWYVVLLLEPESPLWPLLTGVLDGWLVLHATGRVTFVNQHATWLLGSSGAEVGQAGVLVAGSRTPAPLGTVLSRHHTSGTPELAVELQVDRDGLSRWVEAAVVRTNPSGPMAGVVWRLRDVTGRSRVERRHLELSEELQGALDSRVDIEQAKGFLAGRDGIGADEAFRRLRRYARDHNLAIREVSRQVVARKLPIGPDD